MSENQNNQPVLQALRELPTEVSLEQVNAMVVAFPVAVTTTSLLASIKLHLNSILFTGAGAAVVGTGIYMLSGDPRPSNTRALDSVPLTAPLTVQQDTVPAQAPPKAEPPKQMIEHTDPPVEQLACMPLATPDAEAAVVEEVEPSEAPQANETVFVGTAAAAPMVNEQGQRSFDLRDYSAIALHGQFTVEIEQGDFGVRAFGSEEALDRMQLVVYNGVLKLAGNEKGKRACSENVRVVVSMPRIDRFELLGVGNVEIGRFTTPGDLRVDLRGSGNVHAVGLDALRDLDINVSGSGDVVIDHAIVSGTTGLAIIGTGDVFLAGRTEKLEIDITGAGDVDANGFDAGSAAVHIVGTGDAYVHCDGKVEKDIRGAGDVIINSGSVGGNGQRGVGSRTY